MRDYEESFKELRKENFNLKLRIFFLEERMGLARKLPRDELADNNLELKVAIFPIENLIVTTEDNGISSQLYIKIQYYRAKEC